MSLNTGLLQPDDWVALKLHHPAAHALLLQRSLLRELAYYRELKNKNSISEWEADRLKELEAWYAAAGGHALCPKCSESNMPDSARLTIRCSNCDTKFTPT